MAGRTEQKTLFYDLQRLKGPGWRRVKAVTRAAVDYVRELKIGLFGLSLPVLPSRPTTFGLKDLMNNTYLLSTGSPRIVQFQSTRFQIVRFF